MPDPGAEPLSVVEVASRLAERLESAGCDYALGGALALGFWAEPRGTIDVDVTLYLPVDDLDQTIDALRSVGADFSVADVAPSLREHGFCRLEFLGRRLDVFLPIASIYEAARSRRQRVRMGTGTALVWDAESLCVFKMMFYRRKDLSDVEAILRNQGDKLDQAWVEAQLIAMFGERDPRLSSWGELVAESRG